MLTYRYIQKDLNEILSRNLIEHLVLLWCYNVIG